MTPRFSGKWRRRTRISQRSAAGPGTGRLLRLLAATVGRTLLTRGEPRKRRLFAEILAQALDVLDGHEDSVAVGIVQLKILGTRAVGGLEQPSSHVTAEAVRGVEYKLTGIEGGSEFRWQLHQLYPSSIQPKHVTQGTSVAAGGAAVRVAPALATITSPMATTSRSESCWPRKRKPAAAPTAGSKLIRMPKSCLDRRRSAANSSENGMADERMATTSPMPRLRTLRSAPPAPAMIRQKRTIARHIRAWNRGHRGRAIASRMAAPNATRTNPVPAGPRKTNRCRATVAPTWTDAIAPSA